MAASSSADDSGCHLLALSHDELGVIFDGLAGPLQPGIAVALSSTCKGVRTPLRAALEVLQQRHERAVALCGKIGRSCARLCREPLLNANSKRLTADDMSALSMIMRTGQTLPRLRSLWLFSNGCGDAGVQSLCDGLAATPSVHTLSLTDNKFGPAGAEALAAAFRAGVLPTLCFLALGNNALGSQGAAALALPLRKLPALQDLCVQNCAIGAEGLTSLITGLTKDDFKELMNLDLRSNQLTGASCAALSAALDSGAFPKLVTLRLEPNSASDAAMHTVRTALRRAQERREDDEDW